MIKTSSLILLRSFYCPTRLASSQTTAAVKLKNSFKSTPKTTSKVSKDIPLHDGISIATLSNLMNVSFDHLQMKMNSLGFQNSSPDTLMTAQDASLIVLEYHHNPILPISAPIHDLKPRPPLDPNQSYPSRPPIVTIMGHVDHGKTTLLDSIRKTSVAASEAGGITQHVGAFSVKCPSGRKITFLDTPGHAAFSRMRERGAQVTDICVLVVSADDGVMPQTVEAIEHARAANVPLVVAINKIDKASANPRLVKEGLMRYNVMLEEFGGDVQGIPISALKGTGLNDLEDAIITLADIMEIKGDPSGPVEAAIIESRVVRGKGPVATIIVKRGTLRRGATLVAGQSWCKVKGMNDENGKVIKEAGPCTPVEVVGWKELPEVGDIVLEAPDETIAKKVAESRAEFAQSQQQVQFIDILNAERTQRKTDSPLVEANLAESSGQVKKLNVIVKTDVNGSLEAILGSISGLPSHKVEVNVIASGVGPLTASELEWAKTASAHIFTFNVPTDRKLSAEAEKSGLVIRPHTIIYHFLDDMKACMVDLLPLEKSIHVKGEAIILAKFELKGKVARKIAGCKVRTGKISKSLPIRIMRNSKQVYTGSITTFRHHKKDIDEAQKGLECGLGFGFLDFQEGDVIQSIQTLLEKPQL